MANQNYAQQVQHSLQDLNDKLDDLTHSLPNTYVTIRQHEQQIQIHTEKIVETQQRVAALETWRSESTQWAYDQHAAIVKTVSDETQHLRNDIAILRDDNKQWRIILLMLLLTNIVIPIMVYLVMRHI